MYKTLKCKEYKNIIIGGGIAGLNVGHQLLSKIKTPDDFCIIEKNNEYRGRVMTMRYNGEVFEQGAGIVNSNQRNIMKLIRDLDCEDELKLLKQGKVLYYHSKYGKIVPDKKKIKNLWDTLYNKAKNGTHLSLDMLCRQHLSINDYDMLKTTTSDWYEIADQNALTYFNGIREIGCIYRLKNGLGTLIDILTAEQKPYIKFNEGVIKVKYDEKKYYVYTEKGTYCCQKIYLCTDTIGARQIQYEGINGIDKLLYMANPYSTLRYYYYSEKKIDWLKPYGDIITNYPFKWLMRVSDHVVMIAYVDGQPARELKDLGADKCYELIRGELKKILGKDISDDLSKKWFIFWNEAFSVIKHDIDQKQLNDQIGLLPEGFIQTVIPKNYGLEQAWMEAHLIDVN